MEKQLQVWALKKKMRPVLLDTLAAMHVTCEFHCCAMRLYWKHHYIYQKLTGSHITYICIFYCYAEAFFEYFFL